MAYPTILYDTDGAVATLTLNRPERLNTIVPQLLEDLDEAVREANRDPEVKVLVLRGAGRAFCAGFDFGQEFNSGYGKTFFAMDDRKHGEADLGDVVASKEMLIATGYVDLARIGIMGGSYGGYMTLAALTLQPDALRT